MITVFFWVKNNNLQSESRELLQSPFKGCDIFVIPSLKAGKNLYSVVVCSLETLSWASGHGGTHI